jgi:hypothetical protein
MHGDGAFTPAKLKLHKSVTRHCYAVAVVPWVLFRGHGMTAFPAKHQKFQAAMKNGLMNFISATKATKPRRRPHLWLLPPAPKPLPAPQVVQASQLDPVALTVLAVNRLGLATLRTSTSGKVATVAVPDARTAEIFRAALLEMQKNRRTDRLVDVVVSVDDGPAKRPGNRGRDAVEA